MMTVGELRKRLYALPDDIPVVGVGHFGEALETYSIRVGEVNENAGSSKKIKALIIEIEDPGDEPE